MGCLHNAIVPQKVWRSTYSACVLQTQGMYVALEKGDLRPVVPKPSQCAKRFQFQEDSIDEDLKAHFQSTRMFFN